ncbi:hypothetical protein BaRGS_00036474 [Batillaria attramentaria]|uniref:FAD-binding PCMH-type domain-containing protein n=1 Tax=Batillaria attramentaria TaxID=370345 RepID=A0ABD0JBP4_9CAEN
MPLPLQAFKCPVCATSHLPVSDKLTNGVYAANCQNCGFFFKFRAVEPTASTVTFTVNGTSHTVGNEFDPATSLNEWLRSTNVSKGTKQMCIEGGCGVCIVTVKLYEPITMTQKVYAVNSCLTQLYMCDGWEITTIEGLGSPDTQLHPIQQRLAQYNGSQCGYCSPSHVMNMYGFLQTHPQPTKQQIEDNVDSTLCRCTGYRPILDAMKSFAVDAPKPQRPLPNGPIDIEDLTPKMCKKSGQPCTGHCKSNTRQTPKAEEDKETKGRVGRPLHIVGARAQWFKPTTQAELCQLLKQYQNDNYRLVFGNSGYGIYKEIGPWMYDILIDIRGITEFYGIDFDPTIVFGSNLSLNNLLGLFERGATDPATKAYFPVLLNHMKQVATNTIRNLASWAGNLMLKHKHQDFISDVFTMLETVGTQLLIVDGDQNQTQVSLADFLKLDMKGKVIRACLLPTYSGQDNVHIQTYRVSQRLQLDHSYVIAGFNFKLDKTQNYTVMEKPRMVFQGISDTFNHATQTEEYLVGKQLGDPQVLKGALSTLVGEINPTPHPVLASPKYRRDLAAALFYKFVLSVMPDKVAQRYQSGATQLVRPVSSGVQTYGTRQDEYPLTKAMPKLDAEYQTSGMSRFVDDEALVQGELYAAFTVTTEGNATIGSVDATAALAMPGVVKVIQASDIPTGGKNNYMPPSIFKYAEEFKKPPEEENKRMFSVVEKSYDPLVASTAASVVKVTYTNVQKPLLDLEEAIQQGSFFDDKVDPMERGNADEAIRQSARRVTGTIQMGTQYHFHVETHTSRCVPNDDGGMDIQASTQWADGAQEIVAALLNIPQSSVRVDVKRLGGGFGAKLFRSHLTTGACALAAQLTKRPVRMHLDLHTNMKCVGKRWPYLTQYEVGFTEDGKLNGLRATVYGDAGCVYNDSAMGIIGGFIDNVKTNKPANTACRSPGSLPAQFMIESIMEHVAKYLNKDPTDVRKLNLYQKGQTTPVGMTLDYCNIRDLVPQLEASCDLATRKAQVEAFNQANRWKKRGLSCVPTKFGIGWVGGVFSVFVSIYHGDGTVAVDHGGAEMGQGINTKAAQVCAYELGVPLSNIRVKRLNTVTNANSTMNGGSIGTELNCMCSLSTIINTISFTCRYCGREKEATCTVRLKSSHERTTKRHGEVLVLLGFKPTVL